MPPSDSERAGAIDAAKAGDQHRLRSFLDEQGGDVNLRDVDTQGTLLHVSVRYSISKKINIEFFPLIWDELLLLATCA